MAPVIEAAPLLATLPSEVLIFAVLGIVAVVGIVAMVALRPTNIHASHGGKVDYSPRAKVEVARPQSDAGGDDRAIAPPAEGSP